MDSFSNIFKKQQSKQRILIKLDQTDAVMERNMESLLQRGVLVGDLEESSAEIAESSRRLYYGSMPWWKRWLYCCCS